MLYAYTLAGLPAKDHPGKAGFKESEYRVMMDKAGALLRNHKVDASPALYNRILERIALLEEGDIHLLLSVLGRLD